MYQSLHTAVVGPGGHAIEIQIRSWEMHRTAEHGVAAHWRYKEGSRADARIEAKVAWLRQLMEWRDQVADAEEFVESMKSDVFKEQIYVFTPAGDIIELPAGATPVDFAYRIHTEVGHPVRWRKGQRPTRPTRLSAAKRSGRKDLDQPRQERAKSRLASHRPNT